MKSPIVHWIPSSILGGCEIILLTFMQGTPSENHIIITGGEENGPAVKLWEKYSEKIFFVKNWMKKNPFLWSSELHTILSGYNDYRLISWTSSRIPFLKRAVSNTRCTSLVVHVGSLLNISLKESLKQYIFEILANNKSKPKITLIGCSEYVNRSIEKSLYYSKYEHFGILNGVRECFFDNHHTHQQSNILKICTVGRLDPVKKHSQMINYITDLVNKGYSIQFDIIGEGSERTNLQSLINRNNVHNNIKLLGNQKDVSSILDNYQLFLFNSTELEGMGIALAEAMSKGLVCIVNNSELMHEMLGESGLYFNNREEFTIIIEKLMSEEYYSALSEKTQERARLLFSPKVFASKYLKYLL